MVHVPFPEDLDKKLSCSENIRCKVKRTGEYRTVFYTDDDGVVVELHDAQPQTCESIHIQVYTKDNALYYRCLAIRV